MPTIVQLALVGGIGEAGCLPRHGHQEVVRQMRMAAAVAAALQEAQMRRHRGSPPVNLRIGSGRRPAIIGHLHALGESRGSGRPLVCMHRLFVFDLLPLEAASAAGHVEALAILPGGVEQAARHLGDDIGVLDLERRRLDGERAVVLRDQLLADPARAVADDALATPACPGVLRIARHGLTQCVAYHIGGRPGQ